MIFLPYITRNKNKKNQTSEYCIPKSLQNQTAFHLISKEREKSLNRDQFRPTYFYLLFFNHYYYAVLLKQTANLKDQQKFMLFALKMRQKIHSFLATKTKQKFESECLRKP